jgi:hypothetical protein
LDWSVVTGTDSGGGAAWPGLAAATPRQTKPHNLFFRVRMSLPDGPIWPAGCIGDVVANGNASYSQLASGGLVPTDKSFLVLFFKKELLP